MTRLEAIFVALVAVQTAHSIEEPVRPTGKSCATPASWSLALPDVGSFEIFGAMPLPASIIRRPMEASLFTKECASYPS
jgi:hypothetical protein